MDCLHPEHGKFVNDPPDARYTDAGPESEKQSRQREVFGKTARFCLNCRVESASMGLRR